MYNNKAQGAVEFIIILGSVLFFFLVFFAAIQSNVSEKNLEKEKVISQNIALDVQDEINLAAESSEGYYREFSVPENVLGKDYEINITENFVYVKMGKISVSYKIANITGNIQKGVNIIEKQNGEILLN